MTEQDRSTAQNRATEQAREKRHKTQACVCVLCVFCLLLYVFFSGYPGFAHCRRRLWAVWAGEADLTDFIASPRSKVHNCSPTMYHLFPIRGIDHDSSDRQVLGSRGAGPEILEPESFSLEKDNLRNSIFAPKIDPIFRAGKQARFL